MVLPDMTFIPYQPTDLDPFLKVTAAICKLTLPNLTCGTNLLGADNHNVFAVLLFAFLRSNNMHPLVTVTFIEVTRGQDISH